MALFYTLLVLCLLLVAASWALSLAGFMLGLVFKLAPLLLLVLVIFFFAKGGRVHIDLPDDWKK